MTKSSKYLGKLAYENDKKLKRALRSLLKKTERKIKLYDDRIEIYKSGINLEEPGIEFIFLNHVYQHPEEPFPRRNEVKIKYSQDPAYIAAVVREAAMIKRHPKVEFDIKIKWAYNTNLDAFKVIIPIEAYKEL